MSEKALQTASDAHKLYSRFAKAVQPELNKAAKLDNAPDVIATAMAMLVTGIFKGDTERFAGMAIDMHTFRKMYQEAKQ